VHTTYVPTIAAVFQEMSTASPVPTTISRTPVTVAIGTLTWPDAIGRRRVRSFRRSDSRSRTSLTR
jgi:hypothetical protein